MITVRAAKIVLLAGLMGISVLVTGCRTPSRHISEVRLGMTPDEVLDVMGRPYTIRAAKLFRDGNWLETWEYIPSVFSVALFADRYDKTYWITFEGGKVVQWGEPGDFAGPPTVTQDDAAVTEYIPDRRSR